MESYIRKCPICNIDISYSTKYTFKSAELKKTNCKKCSAAITFKIMNDNIRKGIGKNGFSGKTHSDDVKKKLRKSVKALYDEGILNTSGRNNPMFGRTGKSSPRFGKSYIDDLNNKYGEEVANKKIQEIKNKISARSSGKNNPMFGKKAPIGSGNGWGGWYKNFYFRSLHELSFLVCYAERFKMIIESGENIRFRIKYKISGEEKNYYPDFIVNSKYMVECKPIRLWKKDINVIKRTYAEKFCNNIGLKYKLIDPIMISLKKLIFLHSEGIIRFNHLTEEKFKKYIKCH